MDKPPLAEYVRTRPSLTSRIALSRLSSSVCLVSRLNAFSGSPAAARCPGRVRDDRAGRARAGLRKDFVDDAPADGGDRWPCRGVLRVQACLSLPASCAREVISSLGKMRYR